MPIVNLCQCKLEEVFTGEGDPGNYILINLKTYHWVLVLFKAVTPLRLMELLLIHTGTQWEIRIKQILENLYMVAILWESLLCIIM